MQAPNQPPIQPFEVIQVNAMEVACDGGVENQKNGLGHPKVYLHIDADKGEITCPYCSRQYVVHALAKSRQGNH